MLSLVGCSLGVTTQAARASDPLCDALEAIQDGEQMPIVVSGIYSQSYEMQILSDPQRPFCQNDIQPSTWIEFSKGAGQNKELKRLVENDRRAFVTFKGTLFGPKKTAPDDEALPLLLAYANRTQGRRYGHLNTFRTKLVVGAVLGVHAVPDAVPWNVNWFMPSELPPALEVESAAIPLYPHMARHAGIAGRVVIEVSVTDGKVIGTRVLSGDRILAAEATRNVTTWMFSSQTSQRFTTTFLYSLERRRRGEDTNSKVEFNLPSFVKITAPSFGW
jgi:TonB family protein